MDFRSLIAPFIDSIRTQRTIDSTVSSYTRKLNETIDFLENGSFEAPNSEFFNALEKALSNSFAESTLKSRLSLAHRFFSWAEIHKKGDYHSAMNTPDTISEISREGYENTPVSHSPELQGEILEDTSRVEKSGSFGQVDAAPAPRSMDTAEDDNPAAEIITPAIPPVDAHNSDTTTPASEAPLPPQNEFKGVKHLGRPRKSSEKRDKKFSLYLTQSLFVDIQDLARIQRVSTPDFIFSLLEREAQRRADALAAFRALEE